MQEESTAGMTDSRHLAYGILRGGIPFEGKFLDDGSGSAVEVHGDLQWQTVIPDSNPDEGKLDVAMVLFVFGADVGNRPRDFMRLECDTVSRLNAEDAETEEDIMQMLLESTGNAERFDIQRAA